MEPVHSVYGLVDPRTGEVRYVGHTKHPVQRRYAEHLYDPVPSPKSNWIRSLAAKGLVPSVVLLEVTSAADWMDCERRWIKYFRQCGCAMTNICDGGEGATGRPTSEATKERLRAINTGKILSDETRSRVGASSRRARAERSPEREAERRRRISEGQSGKPKNHTPEGRARLSELARKQWTGKPKTAAQNEKMKVTLRQTLAEKFHGR